MGGSKYTVVFESTESVTLYAFNPREAKILAQATMIEEGKSYDVDKVMREDGLVTKGDRIYMVNTK